jgi:nucleoside-diphosphate-sugar epimerase
VSRLIIGCGYLGRRLLELWRALPDGPIYVTTRKPERADELRRLGAEPVICDVLSPGPLPRVDSVVYAVGLDRAAGVDMRAVYVEGLANVLDRLPPPGRFIYVSSTSVYGQDDGGEVDESAPTEPVEASGRIVLEAEQVLRQRLPDALILRLAGIYGPGRLLRQRAIEAGEPLAADPDKWLNLIHVEDAAAAVQAAVRRGQPGRVYNVSDGHPVRRRDFYAYLAQLLAAPPPRFAPAGPDPTDRRIVNRRMLRELGVVVRFPSYREGLAAAVRPA